MNLYCQRLPKKKTEFNIGLDHNLDLLKHHTHKSTQDFLELIVDNNSVPTITRLTRVTTTSATLIDNLIISVNIASEQTSCVLLSDISDHFPCLSIIKNCMPDRGNELTTVKHKLTEKNIGTIKDELSKIDWDSFLPGINVNESTKALLCKLQEILDRVAPEIVIPISTNQVINMSWMMPSILKCSSKQLHLYKKALAGSTSDMYYYKHYRDTLRKLKRYQKVTYYNEKCNEFKNNSKQLWSMINNIIEKTANKQCVVDRLKIDNIEVHNSQIIVNRLAQHFSGIGSLYTNKIPNSDLGIDN